VEVYADSQKNAQCFFNSFLTDINVNICMLSQVVAVPSASSLGVTPGTTGRTTETNTKVIFVCFFRACYTSSGIVDPDSVVSVTKFCFILVRGIRNLIKRINWRINCEI
jgi:hypothetical protein